MVWERRQVRSSVWDVQNVRCLNGHPDGDAEWAVYIQSHTSLGKGKVPPETHSGPQPPGGDQVPGPSPEHDNT